MLLKPSSLLGVEIALCGLIVGIIDAILLLVFESSSEKT
jgi:hypothetical protein